MRMSIFRILTLLAAAALIGGCSEPPPTATPPRASAAPAEAKTNAGITDADMALAKEAFASRCTPCHGPTGAGDGPASKGLTPPPRNFQDAAWQKEVSDEHIEKIVQYGGAAVGRSPAMPPNPDLQPGVVKALRAVIRGLAK